MKIRAKLCSACHHRTGWESGPREVPTLAGQQDSYLLEQLPQFSNLERKKDEMHEVVSKPQISSPQSLRDVSAYIAARARNLLVRLNNFAKQHGGIGQGSLEPAVINLLAVADYVSRLPALQAQ